MMYRLFVFCSIFFIAACSSDGEERPDYLDSYSIKGLEIPPTLTQPDTSGEMLLLIPSAEAMQMLKEREDVSIKGSVSPMFQGLEVKSNDGLTWLEIQQDPDALWPTLKEFWAHEGIRLYRNEPLLGFMETEWVKEYDPRNDDSFLVKMFTKLSPDRLDKFRMRVERIEDREASRVFISHRGLEVQIHDEGGTSWRQRASNPELEREMFNRLVLFAGLTKIEADEIFSAYNSYQPRIRPLKGDDVFEITGDQKIVWQRVMQALDRIGVEILSQDRQQGEIEVLVDNVPEKLASTEDELDESSWLVRLFTGGPGDEELEEGQVTIKVSLQPSEHATRMQLTHAGEALPVIGLAARFEEALVDLLK